MTTLPATPDDFAQRLAILRRLAVGLLRNIDALESDYAKRYNGSAARPAGEVAAQRARETEYRIQPQETKIIR